MNNVQIRQVNGGHDIPGADIERRYFRSLHNFLGEYASLADNTMCYCNADRDPVLVFAQRGAHRETVDPTMLRTLEKMRLRHDDSPG